jgi:hypothetical protein
MAITSVAADGYEFEGGYPTADSVQRAYDSADLNRAVHAYRYFFAAVSGLAIFRGDAEVGVRDNEVFGTMDTTPAQVGLTLNSDTPYAALQLDLRIGPMVVELPPGPLMCAALNLDQGWIADMGLPGLDAGNGGSHLLLPPGWEGDVPDGLLAAQARTNRVLVGVRAIPVGGDLAAAHELIQSVRVRPLDPSSPWTEPTFRNLSYAPQDTSPGHLERRWATGALCTRLSTPSRFGRS